MDQIYMKEAIVEAKKAYAMDEVPIGAVIVKYNTIIARAHNLREHEQLATAHAEILAINEACKQLQSWRLEGCTLYVTLEPCPMCSGASILSRVDRVVFGASDQKGGSIVSSFSMFDQQGYNHYPTYTSGVLADECASLLKDYFKEKRNKK
ncbi:tRNA(adenine34) deaminase [Breznakia blatticola]|uniref:tRNA-specific adenosine deaminase n=1 Tax=Breznakia blatticola TaxID=1754012 RepID=A0A4V3G652_9FIRM|nr:tRNA adenosine(34) deaminase TadA [Breznakia blatticola]TDW13207.1 tRNA(adenine34) deaminase [Breznakia blatticola]